MPDIISKNKRKLGVLIDEKVFQFFVQQARSRGFLKLRAGEAAIKIWTMLPAEIQAQIISGEIKNKKEIRKNIKTAVGAETA